MNFDVLHATTKNRYVDNSDIRLVNLGPIAFFSNCKLTNCSGKHLEDFSHAHIVSLMYKLITSARGSDGLSIGFDRDRNRGQQELTNNKNQKGKYLIRFYLKDFFGLAEHQQKATYGLGFIITLTRNNDSAALNKSDATIIAKIENNAVE